jgi:prepilin-type processing-associated H-X9-DG protein
MGCQNGANEFGMAAQARSRHPGGVNSCFCDGHVQFIRETIGQRTWVVLQSTNDRLNPDSDY